MRSVIIATVIFLSYVLPAHTQLDIQLESTYQHPDIANAQLSVSVRSTTGEVLYERDPDILLMPASTLKTITTMSVVGILGADYHYNTIIGYTGEITADGTLYGDLIIKGSGDPSLGSGEDEQVEDMNQVIGRILDAIEQKGIKCINGYLLIDDSVFDHEAVHPGWPWDDLCNYYAAGVWGINFNENRYEIVFDRSAKPNMPTSIKSVTPSLPQLQLENRVTTGAIGSYDEAYLYGDPYGWDVYASGTIPPGQGDFDIEGAVPDGGMFLGELILQRLEAGKIKIKGVKKTGPTDIAKYHQLLALQSPSIRGLAKFALSKSDNLYCDALLKTIGYNANGIGTWESGVEGIKDYVKSMAGTTDGYKQVDGSGLSSRNRVSPSFMTSFLQKQVEKIGIEEMKYLLPVVGKEGTVKNFLNGTNAQSHAWLKSGSISSVVAYAGVLELKDNQHVMISISSNGHQVTNRKARKQIEQIIEMIYNDLNK